MKAQHSCLRHIAVLILVCATLTLSVVASAQTVAGVEQPTTAAEWTDLLSTNYEMQANITYRRANNTDLKLDLYLPRERSKVMPVLINIHGGVVFSNATVFTTESQVRGVCAECSYTPEHKEQRDNRPRFHGEHHT